MPVSLYSTLRPSPMADPRSNLQSEASRLASTARERAADAVEEFKLASNQLVDKTRELIEEGNVRRISLRKGDRTLLEIPLTVGVGAGAAALLWNPVIAAVGALAALATDVTLVVERDPEAAAEQAGGHAEEHIANVNTPAPSQNQGSDDATKTVGKAGAADEDTAA